MKKSNIALVVLLIVTLAALCFGVSLVTGIGPMTGQSSVSTEDCDADDLVEGDEDCYGNSHKAKKTTPKKTTPKKTTPKKTTPKKTTPKKTNRRSSRK